MGKPQYKKIANTSFHVETVSKMKLKDFKNTYKGILKGQDLDKLYKEITGKKGEDTGVTENSGDNVG